MSQEPRQRYGSAEGLAEDLLRYQGRLPVKARKWTPAYLGGRFLRRNRWGVAAGALIALSLLGGIAATTWQAREADTARQRAEAQQRRAEEVTGFLEGLFRAADPSLTRNRDLTLRSFLDDAARQVPAELTSQPEVQGRLLNLLGEGYRRLGLYEESRSILEQALEIRTAAFGPEHPAVAETLDSLALLALDGNRLEESETLVRRALKIQHRHFGDEHLEVADSLNSLGLVLRRRGEGAAAEPVFRRSLELRRTFLPQPQREVSVSLNNLGLVLQEAGRPEEARPLLEEALGQQLQLYGERHWLTASTRQNLALALVDLEELAAAELQYREALDTQRQLLGGEHPRVAAVLHNLADLLQRSGKGEEARRVLEEAIAINESRRDAVALAANLNLLGNLFYRSGEGEDAAAALSRSLELRRQELGTGHPHFANALHNLVHVLRASGSLTRAEETLEEALLAWATEAPPRDWDLPYAQGTLGLVLLATNRPDEGRALLEEGREALRVSGREDLLRRLEEP